MVNVRKLTVLCPHVFWSWRRQRDLNTSGSWSASQGREWNRVYWSDKPRYLPGQPNAGDSRNSSQLLHNSLEPAEPRWQSLELCLLRTEPRGACRETDPPICRAGVQSKWWIRCLLPFGKKRRNQCVSTERGYIVPNTRTKYSRAEQKRKERLRGRNIRCFVKKRMHIEYRLSPQRIYQCVCVISYYYVELVIVTIFFLKTKASTWQLTNFCQLILVAWPTHQNLAKIGLSGTGVSVYFPSS